MFFLIASKVSESGLNPCELTNLHALNMRNGSSENEISAESGVVITPWDRSFNPE